MTSNQAQVEEDSRLSKKMIAKARIILKNKAMETLYEIIWAVSLTNLYSSSHCSFISIAYSIGS